MFFNDYPLFEVPNRFSYQHFVMLFLVGLYLFSLLFFLKNKSDKTRYRVLITINVICAIVFCLRGFFGWEGSRFSTVGGSKNTLLPLELCNLNIFIMLYAFVKKDKELFSYLFFVSMIGGLIPLLVFPDCHMITAGNNVFHYMFFDYLVLHSNLFCLPICILAFGWYKPRFKDIPHVLINLCVIFVGVFLASVLLRNFAPFATANYMYCFDAGTLPILSQLYELIPYPFLYELPLVVPITLLFILLALPFEVFKKKESKTC